MISDKPIEERTNDLLNRSDMAERLGEVISTISNEDSVVIGIQGPWGSGKTSFLNLMDRSLAKNDKIVRVSFNPWNFSGKDELITDFFASISKALEYHLDWRDRKELTKGLSAYGKKLLSGISINPPLVQLNLEVLFSKTNPLSSKRRVIDSLLRKLDKRIVVSIDDIDRLDAVETRLVFKLVKMTGNFPNTVFLLAYDHDRVSRRLDEDGGGGEDYLKKIIQVSFTLPEPDPEAFYNILIDEIERILSPLDQDQIDKQLWPALFHSRLKPLFSTIRDIKRYVSCLQIDLAIIGKNEINLTDFLGTEAIRVFAPRFYQAIGKEKRLCTGTDSFAIGVSSSDFNKNRKEDCERLLAKTVPEDIRDYLRKIVRHLFPLLDGAYGNYGHSTKFQTIWTRNRRVCSEAFFDKYFSLSIFQSVLPESWLEEVATALDNPEELDRLFDSAKEQGKLRAALSRLTNFLPKFGTENLAYLVVAAFRIADKTEDKRKGILDVQYVESGTRRLAYQVVVSTPAEKRIHLLKKLISEADYPTYPSLLVSAIEPDKDSDSETPISDIQSIEELTTLCARRIQECAESGNLSKTKHAAFLLYRWKYWGNETELDRFVRASVQSDNDLLGFLSLFVQETISESNHSVQWTEFIDRKSVEGFLNASDIDSRLKNLNQSDLSKEQQKITRLWQERIGPGVRPLSETP